MRTWKRPVIGRYFDSLGLKRLPSMQSLKQEYAILLAENKKLYPEQKKAKDFPSPPQGNRHRRRLTVTTICH